MFGTANDVLVRLPPQDVTDTRQIREQLQQYSFGAGGKQIDLRRVEAVSPQVGSELAEQGGFAMIIALLLIFRVRHVPLSVEICGRRRRRAGA